MREFRGVLIQTGKITYYHSSELLWDFDAGVLASAVPSALSSPLFFPSSHLVYTI